MNGWVVAVMRACAALGRVLLRERGGEAVVRALRSIDLHVAGRMVRVELR